MQRGHLIRPTRRTLFIPLWRVEIILSTERWSLAYSHVVGEVVFFLYVRVETVRHFVEIIFADAANETIGLHVLFDTFQLVTQLSERVDDQTFNASV